MWFEGSNFAKVCEGLDGFCSIRLRQMPLFTVSALSHFVTEVVIKKRVGLMWELQSCRREGIRFGEELSPQRRGKMMYFVQ